MGCVAGQRALTRRDSSVLCIGSRFPTIGRCVQFTFCVCVCVCVCVGKYSWICRMSTYRGVPCSPRG